MSFRYFLIISTWKKNQGSSFEQILIPFTEGCIVPMYFFFISWLSPLGKGQGPSFEETWISITQDCFMPTLVEIYQCFRRRRFLKYVDVLSLFRNYLPLEKGGTLYLNKIEFPSTNDALCKVCLKLAPWFWRKIFKRAFGVSPHFFSF